VNDVISEVFLGHFGSCYLASGPTARPKYLTISLKFLLETRLESESLIHFLAFLVQKL